MKDCQSLTDQLEIDLENSLFINEGSEGDLICLSGNNDELMDLDEDLDENVSQQEPSLSVEGYDKDV